jgi:SAM-dependent methyltransferase
MVFVWRWGRPVSITRRGHNHYLREYCADLKPTSVLNLGAIPGTHDKEGRMRYDAYFPDTIFRSFDLSADDDPRHIQGDLMDPPVDMGQFDLVLAMSVIEHIDKPWLAAPKIIDMIKPGGYLYVGMPWLYPIHEGKWFGDHWRATPSGMRHLFDGLTEIRSDWYDTSIAVVVDRGRYWRRKNSAASGFSMLLQRPAP